MIMSPSKKSKKSPREEAEPEKYCSGLWAKHDDPIYKRGWTIAPNMSGRRYQKEKIDEEER
jgi:hypothetical protein|tara:strand:- start:416 stop:598 length:183 start_codon:yes stop_codon:yes gene_type:complete